MESKNKEALGKKMTKQQIIDILDKHSSFTDDMYASRTIDETEWPYIANEILALGKNKVDFICLYCQKPLQLKNNRYICINEYCKNSQVEMI